MQHLFSSNAIMQKESPNLARQNHRGRDKRRRSSGFTLIEVMVALIIFVGGALAIVRIFPAALAVVQTSETRAIATRLAQATLARYESQPFTIPEAIYDYDSAYSAFSNATNNPAGFSDFNGAVVGTATRNASLPRESQRFDLISDLPSSASSYNGNRFAIAQSALGRFRRVTGEKQRVRQIDGSFVVITRFPYLAANFSVYRDHEIEGLRIKDAAGTFDFSDSTINGVPIGDPADSQRPDAPYRAANLTYYISYRYVLGGRIQGVINEPIRFTGMSPVRVLHQGTRVVEGPIKAYLREPLPTAPLSVSDPNPIRGYLNLGATVTPPVVTTDSVDVNDLVGVDYVVADWRWLVADDAPVIETGLAPSTPDDVPRAMSLPSRDVLDEPSGATTLHALLIGRDVANNTKHFYGEWIAGVQRDSFGEYPGSSSPNTDRVQSINQKSGRVLLDIKDPSPLAAPNTPLRSARARVVYRNLDGWGHQIAVAAQNYVPFDPATAGSYGTDHPRQPWREYFRNDARQDRFLYFHPSEAGKTIMVSFEYAQGGVSRRIVDAVVTISDGLVERAAVPPALAPPNTFFLDANTSSGSLKPTQVAVAELSDLQGKLIGSDPSLTGNGAPLAAGTVTAITSIKGASVRARTAWFEGHRYDQAAVTGFRPTN